MDLRLAVQNVRSGKVFYGWWIVAAGLSMTMLSGGLYSYAFSAYFRPLVTEFGWSRTTLSSVISLSRLEGGLIAPIVGFFIDRFGARISMVLGVGIMGTGFLLLSQITDFMSFALVYILVLSVGASLGTSSPIQAALANWFIRRRSLVLGLLFAGFGLGGFVVPVVSWVIENYGWRTAAVGSGLLFWAVGIPLSLVMRHRPEPYGYLPDGDLPHQEHHTTSGGARHTAVADVDFTPMEAIKTRAFWFIAFAWLLWSMLPAIITVHMIPFFIDAGLDSQVAATVFGIYAFTSGISRVLVGWMGDHVNKRYLVGGLWFLQVAGLFLLARVNTVLDIIPFIIVFAPAYGGIVPLRGALQADYFGRKHFATISGIIRAVDLAGTVAGPVAVGWAFDNAGGVDGYRLAFQIIAVLNLAGALAVLAATPPTPPRRAAPADDAQRLSSAS